MQVIDDARLTRLLPFPALIAALAKGLHQPVEAPLRHVHDLPETAVCGQGHLLLMPAWSGHELGVKTVTVFPGNAAIGKPAVAASYVLFDRMTGHVRAIMDGSRLTELRTAAVSALGAQILAPATADTLLIVGTGSLSPWFARAHMAVRPYKRILVWGRNPQKAADIAHVLIADGFDAEAAPDLKAAVQAATTISCVTSTREPLIKGEWLRPGQHLDLVGAFTPSMREADGAAVARARVFVDTREGALSEAGDILLAINEGAITADDIEADLAGMVTPDGAINGIHRSPADITLFKSVGSSLFDLSAATLAAEKAGL